MKIASSSITESSTVVLGFGPQPLDWISKASKLCGKAAVMDPDVARMAGANLAAGTPAALAALRERLAAGALAAERTNVPADAPPGALEWLANGERGMSSEALFTRLSGIDATHDQLDRRAHPFDTADLRRCRLMLEALPSLQENLYLAMDLSPEWSRLIEDWPQLCAVMDEECPTWRTDYDGAPRTYERMRQLLGR